MDNVDVRVAAYQCLVEIASSYYKYLQAYIKIIFGLTCGAIQKEDEQVALQVFVPLDLSNLPCFSTKSTR